MLLQVVSLRTDTICLTPAWGRKMARCAEFDRSVAAPTTLDQPKGSADPLLPCSRDRCLKNVHGLGKMRIWDSDWGEEANNVAVNPTGKKQKPPVQRL